MTGQSIFGWKRAVTATALLGLLAVLFLTTFQSASAQEAQGGNCDGVSMTFRGAEPSPFVLPRDQGQTMNVEPNDVLLIGLTGSRAAALRNPQIAVRVVASGIEIMNVTTPLGVVDSLEPIPIILGERLPPGIKGLYEIEGALIDEGEDICTAGFLMQVGEFCVATAAVTTVATVSSAGALASVVPAMRLMVLPAIHRRRPTGWRRYVPVPDLKWTLITTASGAVAGLVTTTLLFPQTGVHPLSIVNGIGGMITGGGLTFGMGYLGALLTYFMSPEDPEEAGAAGAAMESEAEVEG